MKVFELAALKGVNAKDLAQELGLKSHLSNVPDELIKDTPEEVAVSKPSFVEKPKSVIGRPPISDKKKIQSIKGLGTKSRFWNERKELGM